MNDSLENLQHNYEELLEENRQLRQKIGRLEEQCDKLRGHSGRSNLIIHGIPENEDGVESWDDCEVKVRQFLKDHLNVTNADDESVVCIERAHRLPDNITEQNPCRRIIVNFLSYKQRSRILQAGRKMLKKSVYKISEDFSPAVRAKRRNLIPFLQQAKDDNKKATLIYDFLLIEGERYKYNEITHSIDKF